MGTLRTRTVGGTVVLALLLVLAGCSGGDAGGTPAATDTVTDTPAATETVTPGGTVSAADDGNGNDDGGGSGDGETRDYEFEDGEGYGYEARLANGTVPMAWVATGTSDTSPELVAVNASVGGYASTARSTQQAVFAEVIREDSVGEPFLYVRTPVVLAAGQDLRVGNSWTIEGAEVTVGDGFSPDWERATAEITGTATVAGETCYTMELRLADNGTGPTSCLKPDWPFALAVDAPDQDYRLAEFDRP